MKKMGRETPESLTLFFALVPDAQPWHWYGHLAMREDASLMDVRAPGDAPAEGRVHAHTATQGVRITG